MVTIFHVHYYHFCDFFGTLLSVPDHVFLVVKVNKSIHYVIFCIISLTKQRHASAVVTCLFCINHIHYPVFHMLLGCCQKAHDGCAIWCALVWWA